MKWFKGWLSFGYLRSTFLENGEPSSKKITAFTMVGLICIIVVGMEILSFLSVYTQVNITDGSFRLLDLLASQVLITLIGAVLLLYGVSGWEKVSIFKANNPAPPVVNKTIVQSPNIEQQNITN